MVYDKVAMKLGFTGTREGMTMFQKEQFTLKLLELNPTEFHHGDCEGADAEAHDIVREFCPNTLIHIHPPISPYKRAFKVGDITYAPEDYIPRDYKIVDSTDFLIGAPLNDIEQVRSGSWTTIRYGYKTGKEVKVLKR